MADGSGMHGEHEREYVEYVRARLPALRRTAYQLCGDAHRGDDLVQQASFVHLDGWVADRQSRDLLRRIASVSRSDQASR